MASKFADKDAASDDDDDDDDDAGAKEEAEDDGFNEPPRTLGISTYGEPKASPVRKAGAEHSLPSPVKATAPKEAATPRAAPAAGGKGAAIFMEAPSAVAPAAAGKGAAIPTEAPSAAAPSVAGGVEGSLSAIHKLLEQQNRILAAQSEKIGLLTSEVDGLKRSVRGGESGTDSGREEMSARIKELEEQLQRERLRSGDGDGDDE
jgi:hypothetical protein